MGGISQQGAYLDQVLEFQVSEHKFCMPADWHLPEEMAYFAVAQDTYQFFISGGLTADRKSKRVFNFNDLGQVQQLPDMVSARSNHSLVLVKQDQNFFLYAIGGSDHILIEKYSSVKGEWQILEIELE